MIAYVLHGKKDLRSEARPMPEAGPKDVLLRVRRVGICGSDLHYFAEGHCGAFVPSRPFVLGHEVTGDIVETGTQVRHLHAGQRVAVDPSRPCGACRVCRNGRYNLCTDMKYLGSASTDPPIDGAFASYLSMPAANCIPLPDSVDDAQATLLEPLSVATHAVMRAGNIAGKSVLIQGAGTVGQLILQVARAFGAGMVMAVDVRDAPLALAQTQGADRVSLASGARDATPADGFEVAFEATGSPDALALAMDLAARGGTIVQVGTLPAKATLPAALVMQKELQLVGSFRFANVCATALQLLASGRVRTDPVITHTFGFDAMVSAFETGLSDESALKIQVENADGEVSHAPHSTRTTPSN